LLTTSLLALRKDYETCQRKFVLQRFKTSIKTRLRFEKYFELNDKEFKVALMNILRALMEKEVNNMHKQVINVVRYKLQESKNCSAN
jgi:hypothetical protein